LGGSREPIECLRCTVLKYFACGAGTEERLQPDWIVKILRIRTIMEARKSDWEEDWEEEDWEEDECEVYEYYVDFDCAE